MALNVLALKAVLGIDTDEYERGLDNAGKKASVFGEMLKANLVSKGIEVAAKGMLKLGKAAVGMVQQSVASYADYEQLVGGVETLFKNSANVVKQYAQDAYINAGLSANEYMETVTGFSASLIQSLGGDTRKAAEYADMAITDMSDNANKMGSDMASLQNAYQGFAKQNYTMLDNLKLGYGGTKAEMDRLIKDAMKLDKSFKVATKTTGKGKKANEELAYSYADIVKAIHIVQTELDITGTTQKEAEKTISGSLKRLKSAWQNLITGMGEGNEDKLDMLIDQLVDSAEIAINNLLPVVEKAIYGIVHLIEALAPVIAEKLPGLLDKILPSLTKATATLVVAFTKALIANMPVIIDAAKQILKAVFEAVQQEAPALIPALVGLGGAKVATKGVGAIKNVTDIVKNLGLVKGAADGARAAASSAQAAANSAGSAMTAASGAGITLKGVLSGLGIAALGAFDAVMIAYDVNKLKEAYNGYKAAGDAHMAERETALETYRQLVNEKGLAIANQWAQTVYGIESATHDMHTTERMILNKIEDEWNGVPQNIWDGLKQGWDHYFGAGGAGFGALIDDGILGPIKRGIESAWNWGKDLASNFASGISTSWNVVKTAVSTGLSWIRRNVGFSEPEEGPLSDFHTYAPDMMQLFAQGIEDNKKLITDAIGNSFDIAPSISAAAAPSGGQEFTVPRTEGRGQQQAVMAVDRTVFARLVYELYNEEARRVGVRIAGGAY